MKTKPDSARYAGSYKETKLSISGPIRNYGHVLAEMFFTTWTLGIEWIRS
jgi:hypothetical protein